MTTRSSIYQDAGRSGAENLTDSHQHDLGITISIGDLTPGQYREMRAILSQRIDALVREINADTESLTGQSVGYHVSFDGLRECGEH